MRIDLEDGCPLVMDGDGNGHDCLPLEGATPQHAAAQIDLWAAEYGIDAAHAKAELATHFRGLAAE
jgi:hypothetical protein